MQPLDNPNLYDTYINQLELNNRYRLLNKWFVISNIILALALLIVVTLALVMKPQPVFVELIEDKNLNYKVIPSLEDRTPEQQQLINKIFLDKFVVNIVEIDEITERKRYNEAFSFTTPEIKQRVLKNREEFKKNNPKVRRYVNITNGVFLDNNTYQVDFESISILSNGSEQKRNWTANVKYSLQEIEVYLDKAHFNPIGLVVTDFDLVDKSGV